MAQPRERIPPPRLSANHRAGAELQHQDDDDDEDDEHRVIETDPSGRFERYAQCLGQGAYKIVYKAFDTEEGVEVAWNQLRLDTTQRREAQRLLSEIQILESLRNDHIINFFHSWISRNRDGKDNIYFITELMTSGTLKNYLRKSKGAVKPKVLKSWARQILAGLHYLHTRSPPIIHRDLKCENIFVNGNNGQAKIGDLGLAVVKNREHVSSVLGTPEFMAPELYDEKYDEKVDIYAYGLVILEIVTKEYPYSECSNQAQIYKKVSSGIKPRSLERVLDEETRAFIEMCIEFDPTRRPPAEHLLSHPFLVPSTSISANASMTDLSPASEQMSVGRDVSIPSRSLIPYESASYSAPPPVFMLGGDSSRPSSSSFEAPVTGDSGFQDAAILTVGSARNSPPPPMIAMTRTASTVSSATSKAAEPVVVDAEHHTFEIFRRGLSPNTSTHTVGTVCSVEIIERLQDSQVQVKMIYTRPGRPSQEIKFPFSPLQDTPMEVIEEMVGEGIVDGADAGLAVERLENAVRIDFSVASSASESGSSMEMKRHQGAPAISSPPRSGQYPTSAQVAVAISQASAATFPRSRSHSGLDANAPQLQNLVPPLSVSSQSNPAAGIQRHNTHPRNASRAASPGPTRSTSDVNISGRSSPRIPNTPPAEVKRHIIPARTSSSVVASFTSNQPSPANFSIPSSSPNISIPTGHSRAPSVSPQPSRRPSVEMSRGSPPISSSVPNAATMVGLDRRMVNMTAPAAATARSVSASQPAMDWNPPPITQTSSSYTPAMYTSPSSTTNPGTPHLSSVPSSSALAPPRLELLSVDPHRSLSGLGLTLPIIPDSPVTPVPILSKQDPTLQKRLTDLQERSLAGLGTLAVNNSSTALFVPLAFGGSSSASSASLLGPTKSSGMGGAGSGGGVLHRAPSLGSLQQSQKQQQQQQSTNTSTSMTTSANPNKSPSWSHPSNPPSTPIRPYVSQPQQTQQQPPLKTQSLGRSPPPPSRPPFPAHPHPHTRTPSLPLPQTFGEPKAGESVNLMD
ncbi:hypothetical protein DFS34DRAFT_250180 [Phlyctochytrium arcticum]|nr:hypothetical protein DFS34DRAFT_250180 [Phlyctochytrium arcticum]